MLRSARSCRPIVSAFVKKHFAVRQVSGVGQKWSTNFVAPTCSNFVSKRYGTVESGLPTYPPQPLSLKEVVDEKVLKAIKAWDRFPQDRADKLNLDARFVEDLSLDSLDLVEITMSLEEEFGFEFPESNIDKFKTPRDISKFVCEQDYVKK
ncbi:Acyl carrier protein [Aphelenchoides besseyi]|nr:Acyl carrier protein [Aphelenchoides besseyi]KAI6194218.1 Acyl carrier protein [Aphelenchoides besseyi]